MMNGFIAVHCGKHKIYLYEDTYRYQSVLLLKYFDVAGAGYHSDSLKKDYQKTCYAACRKAAEALRLGGNAVDAVEKAIIG